MDLEEVVLKAGSAYSDGKYEDALQLYQRAVLGHPHNAVLHANISAILSRLGKHVESLKHAETAVSLQPKWGKASYRKGEALRHLGQHRSALLAFCTALRYELPTKQCLLALKESGKKVFPGFPVAEMEKLGLQDDPFALLTTIGQLYLTEGSLPESIQILTWSLQLDSSCMTLKASALTCLGSAHFKSGNPRRAVDYYEQQLDICTELGTNIVPALRNIATAAEAAYEWELALANRRKIFEHKELSAEEKEEERQNIAELLLQMGRGEEAFYLLKMKTPHNLRARINLACARAYTGDGGNTVPALQGLRPSDERLFARAVVAVSRSLVEEGRLQEAVSYLEEILVFTAENDQNSVWKKACSLASKTYIRMGNVESSINLAKQLLRMGRNSGDREAEAEALRLLGAAYEQQGDYKSTIVLLENCLSLLKFPVERVKLHLELARVFQKSSQDPDDHLGKAVDSAECSSDSSIKVLAFSQALRHFKSTGKVGMAENLLQRQKELLHYDLDGTTRSIIFEDLAFMAAEEGGSTVLALEHSLAEAQEANNILRELELLERMGDELNRLGKRREAEGFYQRFLALAKQLRIAEHIQRGHEKLAREYRSRADWSLCIEHARNALTISKIQQDMTGRISMLLLIAEAEIEKNDLDTALYVLNKSLGLAEAAQMTQLESDSHRLLASVYRKKKDERAEIHEKKFISLSFDSSKELCEALISLSKSSEPAEAVAYLKRAIELSKKLETKEADSILQASFCVFLQLDLVDEAISCLNGLKSISFDFEPLFSLPLIKQLPILLYLNDKNGHDPSVHGRLLLLGEKEQCDSSPTCSLLSVWNAKNWPEILRTIRISQLDLSILPSDVLELMEMTADWHENRVLPKRLTELTDFQKEYLHSLAWSHPSWKTIPFARNKLHTDAMDLLSPELSLLDKIVWAVLSGQNDLVPMWFEELLVELRSSIWSPFPWQNVRKKVLLATVFVALGEDDPLNQIWILERAKWELDKHLLMAHNLSPPSQVSSLLFTQKYSYLFSIYELDLIWTQKADEIRLFMGDLSSSPCFYIHLLSKFLRSKGIKNLDLQENFEILVTNGESKQPAARIVPYIRDISSSARTCHCIWLLSMSSLTIRGAVDCESQKLTQILKKITDSHILILDPQKALTLHEIMVAGSSPDVVLSTGPIPFEIYSAFLLLGSSVIIEVENVTQVAIQIFVDQLRMGDPVSICASHLKCRLFGDPDFRIESDATLGQLRRIIREDNESFLLLARSWRQDGKQDEPWTAVAKGLITLSSEQMGLLIPLLEDYSTKFVNKIYNEKELLGKWEALNDGKIKDQWALLYSDHLFLDDFCSKNRPKMAIQKRSPIEDGGYASDEYMVARRSVTSTK